MPQNIRGNEASLYSPEVADPYGRRYSLQEADHGLPQHQNMHLNPIHAGVHTNDAGHLQMQMMQLEIMKIQALAQMQQIAQAQANQVQYPHDWYQGLGVPVTAEPRTHSFNPAAMNPYSLGRGFQPNSHSMNDVVPMTAALGGKFGSRSHQELYQAIPENGTSNHNSRSQNTAQVATGKGDAASSWRRGSKAGLPETEVQDSAATELPGTGKYRPRPLRFSQAVSPSNAQAVSGSDSEAGDDSASSKSDDQAYSSSPTTPLSNDSGDSASSSREEASKKLFQGLGIGRPPIQITVAMPAPAPVTRIVSQLTRQPRGPPSASDELREKNFSGRIRKRAIGGLGVLLEAREKRDSFVELTA